MDDRMQEFLDRTRSAAVTMGTVAGAAARLAGKKTGEAVGVAKRNIRVLELERQIQGKLQDIGQAVYESIQTGESRSELLDARMAEVEELYAAIETEKEAADALRNVKKCPACGNTCGHQDRYCKHCGAAL